MDNFIKVYENNHGYALINGRLIECDITKLDFCFTDNESYDVYLWVSHADWTEKIEPENFFLSIDDFRSNKYAERTKQEYLNRWFPSKFDVLPSHKGEFATFVIENGQVKSKVIDFDIIEVYYDENGNVRRMESPDIPAECWAHEEDAKAHLEIEIVNADGTTKTIPSAASLVSLSPEQRALVKDIEGLMKKASDMGVKFVADWNGVYAFNSSQLKSFSFVYEYNGYERIDLLSKEFSIDAPVSVVSDEDMLEIVRKED